MNKGRKYRDTDARHAKEWASPLITCQLTLHNIAQQITQQVAAAKLSYWSNRLILQAS